MSFTQRLDDLLDATVVGSFTNLGHAVRSIGWSDDLPSMAGRTVVITGATSGLGRVFARRSRDAIPMTSLTASGEANTVARTSASPASIRLAISTSPSRVSRDTEPILRKYMRTGSLVRE